MTAPVTSTIASTAPTSWKWTSSTARAVHPGLGLGQAREDPRRTRHHRGRELAGAEDREDVAQLAVLVADGGVQDDVGLGGAERAAPHLTRLRA